MRRRRLGWPKSACDVLAGVPPDGISVHVVARDACLRQAKFDRSMRERAIVLVAREAFLGRGGEHVVITNDRGVVARIVTGPHDAHRQDSYLPMRYDTGRPRAVIRLKISQPRTTSLPCPAGLRARRPSPMMDL